jgi:hypothetical protein
MHFPPPLACTAEGSVGGKAERPLDWSNPAMIKQTLVQVQFAKGPFHLCQCQSLRP